MSSSALEHFLEHALAAHAPFLEHSFPACFDWMRLVRDVPGLAERASAGGFDALDRVRAHGLQEQADAVFRTAHTVALGVICAADDETADPEDVLDRFDDAPEDEEEQRFELLVSEVLGPAEAFLSDPEVELDARGVHVQRLHALAWPYVAEYVARLQVLAEDADDDFGSGSAEAEHGVLLALARVAALLACLRWMAHAGDSTPDDDDLW